MSTERSERKVFLVLWGALSWSLFMFFYLIYTSANVSSFMAEDYLPGGHTHSLMTITALVALIFSFVLPRFLFRVTSTRQNGVPTPRDLFVPWILRMALAESVSLFGFILGFSSNSVDVAIPFFAVTILIYLTHFPSESNLQKWIETRRF
ncbi:MAG TPA: hypothetical protein VM901_03675 [Bdellovibrionota bacterium]|jgi:hypothetical protein|nr:hypothetical protein [Bdellovibrionota bacterium]